MGNRLNHITNGVAARLLAVASTVIVMAPAAAFANDEEPLSAPVPPTADEALLPAIGDSPEATAETNSETAGEPAKPPVAENMDLSEPVEAPVEVQQSPTVAAEPEASPAADEAPADLPPLVLLGTEVPAGTSTRLSWSPAHSFAGIAGPTPVLVVNGAKPGPVLCLTAAIHGDELNGIEVVRRVLYDLDARKLSGTVIGVPIVNLQGFRRGSRYLPDRRDLNRFFPGNARGSSAARIARSFFDEVIQHCTALVDLHTGSFHRTNLPQLRADLRNPAVVELTQGFGSTVVLHSEGADGTLRRAATDAGIPAVTLEAGEPARVQSKAVSHGAKGVMTLLNELGMYKRITMWGHREPVYYRSTWVRADRGGVLFSEVDLGERVTENQLLGTITDPITNVQTEVRASASGRVLGMAVDQFVMPGFAAFRIGIEAPDGEMPWAAPFEENDTHTDEELAAAEPPEGDDSVPDARQVLDEDAILEDSE
ncbi:MAG: succinylglutamate desuccinylase/aspartoacylase family protein [Pseudomonadota bacterium]